MVRDCDMTDQDELYDDEELQAELERREKEGLDRLADLEGLPDVYWRKDLVKIQDPDDKAEAIREAEDIQQLEKEVIEKRGRGKGMDYQVHFKPMQDMVATRASEAVLKTSEIDSQRLPAESNPSVGPLTEEQASQTTDEVLNEQDQVEDPEDPPDFVPYGRQVIMDVLKAARDSRDTPPDQNPSEAIPTQHHFMPQRLEDIEEPFDPDEWADEEPDESDLLYEDEILAREGLSLAEQLAELERLEKEREKEKEPKQAEES